MVLFATILGQMKSVRPFRLYIKWLVGFATKEIL
jgi:hypothetical protein